MSASSRISSHQYPGGGTTSPGQSLRSASTPHTGAKSRLTCFCNARTTRATSSVLTTSDALMTAILICAIATQRFWSLWTGLPLPSCPDQLRGLLTDHHGGGMRVSGSHDWHDRRVGDAQAPYTGNPEFRIDDGQGIHSHPARTGAVEETTRHHANVGANIAPQLHR